MGRGTIGAVLASAVMSGCGAGGSLQKLEDSFQVAGGGTDPGLLGTFRLDASDDPASAMLRLLVMKKDGTFHAELIESCRATTCAVSAVDGQFEQTRDFPDPSRASGVVLTSSMGSDAGSNTFRMQLRRASISDSPQVGLYHSASTDLNGRDIPYFEMSHPLEMWCAGPADCDAQELSPSCSHTCSASLCACSP